MKNKQKIYDISLPISESLAVWPGDPAVEVRNLSHTANGDEATTSIMTLGTHTGTHVDAPAHFITDGHGVDQLDLDILVGPALVVNAREASSLTAEVLDSLAIPKGYNRILFHTQNSQHWTNGLSTFNEDYVPITEDGADWLISRGVKLVGIDSLSVAPYGKAVGTHQILLFAGIVILEGLDLREVGSGIYEMICLPLKIVGADGAPARAVLIENAE